ncbi:XdhC family protein [Enterobacter sp. 186315]
MADSLLELSDEKLCMPEQAFCTDDSREILRFATDAMMSGHGVVLVTLVEIRGGASRPLGAQMAVRDDGRYCGFVSGGCVEAAASFEALAVMESGQDREIKYGEGSLWFDIVLPCGGGITLALHRLHSPQPLLSVLNCLEQRKSAVLRYDPLAKTLSCLSGNLKTGWDRECFNVMFQPCVRLIVFGRSIEAHATAALASATGYDVHTVEGFPATSTPDIDSDTAVVLLSHDLNRELPVLQAARGAQPFYIGALGSQRTHAKRQEKLRELGWQQSEIDQIKAPIGIFPKARDAKTLALSVLADIAAVRLRQQEE